MDVQRADREWAPPGAGVESNDFGFVESIAVSLIEVV